jgi:ketosteroid isomerase-like protein
VAQQDVELVIEALTPIFTASEGMHAAVDDDAVWKPIEGRIDPNAEIDFIAPDASRVGQMAGPFHGVDGMRAGWREWLGPWESFQVEPAGIVDAGGGTVLAVGRSRVRMRGSATEMAQEIATLVRIEKGRIVGIDFFLDADQARRDAGLD